MQDSLNIIQDATISEDSVKHYGVMGMKWGHRKQMAQSMGISSRKLKKQIKKDNRNAFLIGKEATLADKTYELALKQKQKALKKAQKSKSYSKTGINKKLNVANLTLSRAENWKKLAREQLKEHHKYLSDKYGSTLISDIKADKAGNINERVRSFRDGNMMSRNQQAKYELNDLNYDSRAMYRRIKRDVRREKNK